MHMYAALLLFICFSKEISISDIQVCKSKHSFVDEYVIKQRERHKSWIQIARTILYDRAEGVKTARNEDAVTARKLLDTGLKTRLT